MKYEQFLSHGEPIIIYMHGNSDARVNEHRVELYRKLQDINCHVIAVDYRGNFIPSRLVRYGLPAGWQNRWKRHLCIITLLNKIIFRRFRRKGYGDSTDAEIDETGLVSDVMETFKWVYERANGTPIFGWGHSLGTG